MVFVIVCVCVLFSLAVCRKSEIAAAPVVYSRKMKGTTLVRKASFSGRPSLHQYEVKGQVTYIV